MKKNLLNIFMVLLLLPVIMFSGCKKSELKAIDSAIYLKDEIQVISYGILENDGSLAETPGSLTLLTQKKAKTDNLSKYLKFVINAQPVMMYKMYIEYISFYIYCNESADQMTINFTMSNLASEDGILNSKEQTVEPVTVEEQLALSPKAKKKIRCTIPINKTIATATGSTITIDVLNSTELFSGDEETNSTFMWLIYKFEIHGESRSYTRI